MSASASSPDSSWLACLLADIDATYPPAAQDLMLLVDPQSDLDFPDSESPPSPEPPADLRDSQPSIAPASLPCTSPLPPMTGSQQTAEQASSQSPTSPSQESDRELFVPRRRWSNEEHATFLELLAKHCPSGPRPIHAGGVLHSGLGQGVAKRIAEVLGTRSPSQVRSHAQKYFQKLSRRMVRESGGGGTRIRLSRNRCLRSVFVERYESL
eukprot:765549-Hanusia_phi.AAC.6